MIRPGTSRLSRKILVAVDGSTISEMALREAITLAKDQAAPLRLLHVVGTLGR